MTIFTYFVAAIGCLTLLIFIFGVVASLIGAVLKEQEQRIQKRIALHEDIARKELGMRILIDAPWFSESPETYRAFQLLGSHIGTTGGYRTDTLRDEWRKANETALRAE